MKTLFVTTEIVTDLDAKKLRAVNHDCKTFDVKDEAVADARKRATKYIGDVYGVFEMTGTVTHPIPELEVSPVTS